MEENKDLLISLINSIVSEKDQVKEVTLLNPYNPKNFLNKDKLLKELNNKELKKALNVLEVINLSDEEREKYENCLNWLSIEASADKREEERGRAEEKIEMAKEMLRDNKPIERIVGSVQVIIRIKLSHNC